MRRIVGETRFDFMGIRWLSLGLSLTLMVASIGILMTRGIEKGVEFAGGADVILNFIDPPALEDVRQALLENGLSGGSVTAFGDSGGAEIVIRVPLPKEEEGQAAGDHTDLAAKIVDALRPEDAAAKLASGLIDLNLVDEVTLADRLAAEAGLDEPAALEAAAAITKVRREGGGLFRTMEEVEAIEGIDENIHTFLREHAFLGPFALRGQEFIEASVSSEMRDKAVGAIFGALGGMLIYIWIRFQFQWGLAAILALVHDTILTLGAFSLAGMEANLPVVAAFLTLVGYSVNDTIVVFDRIRENLKARGSGALMEVINLSINQNLSRTLITSLTTLLAVFALFAWGGPVIHPFAFVLLIGVIVGTYSSIYIASPVLLIWRKLFPGKGVSRARSGMPRGAKKVSS